MCIVKFMAEPNRTSEASIEPRPPGFPRWLKVSAVVVVTLIAIAVVVALIVGGDHGPGGH